MDTSSNDTVTSLPSKRIGRYEIVGECGRGSMGVVFKGFDPTINRTVAIKTVLVRGGDQTLLERFKREAQAAGVLNHPNIVTIYDAGEDQGVFYIAMEFVEGESLMELIARGPLPLEQATAVVEQVGSALDHAHDKQIVHRDIKPANIMITQGRAKVMDFGVAKVASSTATATGVVIGTPSYMSPEGVKGIPVDGRADLFSLGIVLYEMLTGRRPFIGDSIPSVIYKILGHQPDPVATINPNLHNGLDLVLAKALAKAPEERYQKGAEFTRDLKNFHSLKDVPATKAGLLVAPVRPSDYAHTLAPPLVSGTVAEEPGTIVAKPPLPAPRPTPPPVPPPPAPSPPRPKPPPPPPVMRPLAPSIPRQESPKIRAVEQKVPGTTGTKFVEPPRKKNYGPWIAMGALLALTAAVGVGAWLAKHRAEAEQRDLDAKVAAAPAPHTGSTTAKPSPSNPTVPAVSSAVTDPTLGPSYEVEIKSDVKGAVISIDDATKSDWRTPRRIMITAGAHRIEVSKSGYKAKKWAGTVNADGPREVILNLPPAAGDVDIETTPPGAIVVVDGKEQDAPTPSHYKMAYGEHTVEVRKDGFHAESKALTVNESATGWTVSLRRENGGDAGGMHGRVGGASPSDGRLRVRTVPPNAEVVVDGVATDFHSPVNFPLSSGKHRITLKHRGIEPVTREVIVTAGQMTELEVNLMGGSGVFRAPRP